MKNLDDRRVPEKRIKWVQRNAFCQRVHDAGGRVIVARHCELHQTEFRIICPFSEKFGIDRHIVISCCRCTEFGKVFGRCDGSHQVFLFVILCLRPLVVKLLHEAQADGQKALTDHHSGKNSGVRSPMMKRLKTIG